MKKNRLLGLSILATVILGTEISVFAEVPQSATSKGAVTFEENKEETQPVEPDDPSQLITPDDPSYPTEVGKIPEDGNAITHKKGPLSLDVVPNFDFGVQNLTQKEMQYQAQGTDEEQAYLQVTDNRDDANGWIVRAQRTEFADSNGTLLTGTTLALPAGTARNAFHQPSAKDEITDGTVKAQETETPIPVGSEVTIFQAQAIEKNGKGSSTDSWQKNQTTLSIPELTAKKGAFTSEITWVLAADVKADATVPLEGQNSGAQ